MPAVLVNSPKKRPEKTDAFVVRENLKNSMQGCALTAPVPNSARGGKKRGEETDEDNAAALEEKAAYFQKLKELGLESRKEKRASHSQ